MKNLIRLNNQTNCEFINVLNLLKPEQKENVIEEITQWDDQIMVYIQKYIVI